MSQELGDDRMGESPVSTPFKERALEEQKWRDQMILNVTPGLKKRSEKDDLLFSKIGSDPDALRTYLRDLSSVLVSQQKKNLTELIQREESVPANAEQDRGLLQKTEDHTLEENRDPLADSIFGRLKNGISRTKIRKIDPVVIKDTDVDLASTEMTPDPMDVSGESISRQVTPHMDLDMSADQESALDMASGNVAGPTEGSLDSAQKLDIKSKIKLNSSSDMDSLSDADSQSDLDHASDEELIDPLPIGQLRKSLRSFLRNSDIKLDTDSWKALQNVSEVLVKKLGESLVEENRMVPDRQNILKLFERYGITSQAATNDELFELCCKYLRLEELNSLEMSLFL
ncbi:hypothetical protein HG535_0G04920 [Zygotorulaspora mrakii]|uniref:Uncharacterized protein n=1 Tax=Zygotorulaspora mrakii TaxID=42260 RepID=A0A7H9B9B8_ZYGMR|nr:uncharacterized protein HG535_0G04920 [Zygotorulaspora mrakii]QLG74609.1 hypothetical protein HG535_0G04920 [Zygotorulaspora mrakii]